MRHDGCRGRTWTMTIPTSEYRKLIEENADNRFTAAERQQKVCNLEYDLKKLRDELANVRKALEDMTWWKNHYFDQVCELRQKLADMEKGQAGQGDEAKADAAKEDAAPAQEPLAE